MKKEKNKKKLNIKTIAVILFTFICAIGLVTSLVGIMEWKMDSNNTNKEIEEINDLTDIEEVKDNDNTEIIKQDEIAEDNPYWDYIKMNLINVNFTELKKNNSDTVGWIQVNGTNINYPFVQTNNNDYYLTHSFNKSYNDAGWVFADYRNNIDTMNKNTIIYAHGRYDKTMFGTLKNILTNGWLKNTDNYVIKMSTESENTLWQVFSVYKIPTTSDYLKIDFNDDNEFIEFANMLINRSQFNFNTSVSETDHIITLSTCYDNDNKVVLHAKLIKKENRMT